MAKYLKRELKMLNHFNNGDVTKWTVSYQCHKKVTSISVMREELIQLERFLSSANRIMRKTRAFICYLLLNFSSSRKTKLGLLVLVQKKQKTRCG